MDFGFFKNIQIRENMKLQLRSEFYNVFNHANMFVNGSAAEVNNCTVSNPVTQDCITRGVPSFKDGRRQVQFAVKFIF